MELTSAQQKSQELLQTIITKAWEEEAFKQELIANPIKTIEKVTGERINLPEGKALIVKDQTDDSVVYINIPSEPNMEDLELSEEQLEVIAGGGSIWPIGFPIIISTDPAKDGFQ
ncbi:NHLP leader peptide family RiPP precursor [Polaribacter cellanae]|uniref:NHLP leader peptide family RiPP n=1 Tax=Polaribacter cellanae TaxID=2818493 RepID=A0A975H7Q4_9FLAO|nr:NHLP leader peptide family RiPP precursor [Polaribacter cellanae]QTE23308.1 NHLP leader peptide family RiPP precursor [Polaribacter cellanae]